MIPDGSHKYEFDENYFKLQTLSYDSNKLLKEKNSKKIKC